MKRGRQTLRAKASQRLAEMYRFAKHQVAIGADIDAKNWAFVLATTLACGAPGIVPLSRSQRSIQWHGLDLLSLKESMSRCDLAGWLADDELAEVMHRVFSWQSRNGAHLVGQRAAGELLGLTAAEREVCGIRTIDACDETKAERKKRLAAARREKDRHAKQARRQGKHRPRVECQDDAERRRQFCRENNITVRTLRRWIVAGRVDVRSMSAFPASLETSASQPNVRSVSAISANPPEANVRFVSAHDIESSPSTDTLRTPVLPPATPDTIQLSFLGPPQAHDEIRAACDGWTSGPMPEAIRIAYVAAKRRRAMRQQDVADSIAISRPQLANATAGTFNLSPTAIERFKSWLLTDDADLPPPADWDRERLAGPPHHRRGGKRPPSPGPIFPSLRLFSLIPGGAEPALVQVLSPTAVAA